MWELLMKSTISLHRSLTVCTHFNHGNAVKSALIISGCVGF